MLVADRALEAVDGNIVIAVVGGELTQKRLSRRNGQVRLLPQNLGYHPIEFNDDQALEIWGGSDERHPPCSVKRLLPFLMALAVIAPAMEEILEGKIIRISDGETLVVLERQPQAAQGQGGRHRRLGTSAISRLLSRGYLRNELLEHVK